MDSVNIEPPFPAQGGPAAGAPFSARPAFSAGSTLGEIFAAQARATPDAVAVSCDGAQLTYAELNRRANAVARRLAALGVTAETLVGIAAERGIGMIVGLLGIVKAGGAYVPLDLSSPPDRLAFILEDAAAPVLLTQRALREKLPPTAAQTIFLDDIVPEAGAADAENPACPATPESAAYVIYTSGSTGRPKGCLVTHANVVRLFTATAQWFGFGAADVWTMFHSVAFDFSVWEIWGALLHGGRLVVVPFWTSRSPEQFLELLEKERVTVLNQTPSAFRGLIRADEAREAAPALALRFVIFGGEALEFASLRPWFARRGDTAPRLVNMYGITETTVHVTYRPVTFADLETNAGSVIGVPIPDLQIHLLDENRQPVAPGEPGEMYVGGAGVARGYWRRPELTAERFLDDPFVKNGRLYKSGDLARQLPGGEFVYLGRIDQQVKIRGFRVELGEIESALLRHPGVREAAVIARGRDGENILATYFAGAAAVAELRDFLRGKLPDYMVPGLFQKMDALPLTTNGKLDRRALPEPEAARPETPAPPRSELEKTIAAVWREVLGGGEIGTGDNFFDIGGNSLRMTEVQTKLVRALRTPLSMTTLFQYPTIAALARHIGAPASAAEPEKNSALAARARQQREALARKQLSRR